jgi:hypothetical protein
MDLSGRILFRGVSYNKLQFLQNIMLQSSTQYLSILKQSANNTAFPKANLPQSTTFYRVKSQLPRDSCPLYTGSTGAARFAAQQKPLLTTRTKLLWYQYNRNKKKSTGLHKAILQRANASHLEQMD